MNMKDTVLCDVRRLGKYSPERVKPRQIIVTLQSVWSVRKALASASLLKNYEYPVFLSAALTHKQADIENKI